MADAPHAPSEFTPFTHADPLLAATLRAATEAYIDGRFDDALNRLLDLRAIARTRPDWWPLEALTAILEHCLATEVLPFDANAVSAIDQVRR